MVPTFKMHGSKARIAQWIVSHIKAKNISKQRWIEPFAGRGNVFFRAASELNLGQSFINDINTAPFLTALRDNENFDFVDVGPIDKRLWQKWKDSPDTPEKWLAESYVARFGSSYRMGPGTAGGDSKNRHSRENTIKRMQIAQHLLRLHNTCITQKDWWDFLCEISLGSDDIVYLDPPYDIKQNVHFFNINHHMFLSRVKELPCHVFVSGYSTPRYEEAFADWHRNVKIRASVGKCTSTIGSHVEKAKVFEVLWWNQR